MTSVFFGAQNTSSYSKYSANDIVAFSFYPFYLYSLYIDVFLISLFISCCYTLVLVLNFSPEAIVLTV